MKLQDHSTYLMNKTKMEILFSIATAIITIIMCKTKILMYPVMFIAFDIISIIATKFASGIYSFWYKHLSLEDKLEYLEKNYQALDNWYPSSDSLHDLKSEARYHTSEEKNEIKNLIEQNKKEVVSTDKNNVELNSCIETYNEFKKKIKVVKTEENSEFLKNLLANLKELLNLLSENSKYSVFTNKVFNLYMPELIILMDNVPNDKEQLVDYNQNMMETLSELDNLAKMTKKAIDNFAQKNIDISFSVLKKEIRKAGEEFDLD